MTFGSLTCIAGFVMALGSTAGAIDVYTGKTVTPEPAKSIPAAPANPSMDEVTNRRLTALRRREVDRVTSKPIDVVYSASIDGTTGQPATVIYATRLDPVTSRPLDVFSFNERKSGEWVASTQLDPETGKPIGTVYARRFDVRTGRPVDIIRTVPLRSVPATTARPPLTERDRTVTSNRRQPAEGVARRELPAASPNREAPATKTAEPAKTPAAAASANAKGTPTPASTEKATPTRAALAGTWWCVAPSWSSGVIEMTADGTYTRPGGVKGAYEIRGTEVIFDGPLKSWDNGRAKFDNGNLIFEWTNPDGGKNYFAFRKG